MNANPKPSNHQDAKSAKGGKPENAPSSLRRLRAFAVTKGDPC